MTRSIEPEDLDVAADPFDDEVDGCLSRFDAAMQADDLEAARAVLDLLERLLGPEEPELLHAVGLWHWRKRGPTAGRPWLERAVALEPDFADAHHALGWIAEELGDNAAVRIHFLRVLALDAGADEEDGIGTAEQLDFIEEVAAEVLGALPDEFRQRLANVPVVLEDRPSGGLVASGFDPRALGLFEGLEDRQRDELHFAPTRIVLYFANLLASFPDDADLEEQIEVTVLHEVGHFFGLDEDDVARLGLE